MRKILRRLNMNELMTPARRWASLAVLVGAVLLLAIDATGCIWRCRR